MYPFKEGSFAPRNAWYVAAFSEDIGEKLLSRWILGEPVVLYRKQDGSAVAVGGRCPHRFYPLGESERVGDTIQCGYHGFTFGPDGRCTKLPSQQTVPSVFRIPSYPLVERGLWAFIWPGDPEQADESLLPTEEEMGIGVAGCIYKPFRTMHVQGRFHVLGGNQSDGVTITRIAKDRCIAVRRPVYKAAPATAKPVELAATGALSNNEA